MYLIFRSFRLFIPTCFPSGTQRVISRQALLGRLSHNWVRLFRSTLHTYPSPFALRPISLLIPDPQFVAHRRVLNFCRSAVIFSAVSKTSRFPCTPLVDQNVRKIYSFFSISHFFSVKISLALDKVKPLRHLLSHEPISNGYLTLRI